MRYKCTHKKIQNHFNFEMCFPFSLFSVTLKRIYLVAYNYKQYQLNSYGPAPISIIKNTKVVFGCKCLGLYLNCNGNIESELKWIGLQFQRVAWYLMLRLKDGTQCQSLFGYRNHGIDVCWVWIIYSLSTCMKNCRGWGFTPHFEKTCMKNRCMYTRIFIYYFSQIITLK
jgi:hypothetical protein